MRDGQVFYVNPRTLTAHAHLTCRGLSDVTVHDFDRVVVPWGVKPATVLPGPLCGFCVRPSRPDRLRG